MKKVLFLVNHDVVIYNFRRELVQRVLQENYEAVVVSPDGERIELLKKMGCRHILIEFNRHGKNPVDEYRLYSKYKKIIKKENPDYVLSYTIKPNLYGALVAKKYKIPCIVNITGLGTALENKGILQLGIIALYRYAFRSVQTVFVQNEENQQFFRKHHIAENKLKLLPGSGVNLEQFPYEDYVPKKYGSDIFLFVGRIMKDKGVDEYIEAAERIKRKFPDVSFEMVGFMDGEYKDRLADAEQRKIVTYFGKQLNMLPFYRRCSAVVLPSYHEGMANVLLEAAAVGRPILASNISGCRETFDEGVTGFGFESKNAEALWKTIEKFMFLSEEQKESMGRAGRKKVEKEFDRAIVVDRYMKELMGKR